MTPLERAEQRARCAEDELSAAEREVLHLIMLAVRFGDVKPPPRLARALERLANRQAAHARAERDVDLLTPCGACGQIGCDGSCPADLARPSGPVACWEVSL